MLISVHAQDTPDFQALSPAMAESLFQGCHSARGPVNVGGQYLKVRGRSQGPIAGSARCSRSSMISEAKPLRGIDSTRNERPYWVHAEASGYDFLPRMGAQVPSSTPMQARYRKLHLLFQSIQMGVH